MSVWRNIRFDLFLTDVEPLTGRLDQPRERARIMLRRKRAEEIAKAALLAAVTMFVVTALVVLKWVVWGNYFNH